MTATERQQSLAAARRACEWLIKTLPAFAHTPREELECLIAEFKRLDAGEQKRNAAGAAQRRLNAQYGILGGRPKKAATTKKRGKK
jgi:hypothetical protein